MIQARPVSTPSRLPPPRVSYRVDRPAQLLDARGTLAVIGFGRNDCAGPTDPRLVNVALPVVDDDRAPVEHWRVDAEVSHGCDGDVRFARGGGWLLAAVEVAEANHDEDIGRSAEHAYRALCGFLSRQPDGAHVHRLWNYLDRINEGSGDAERYKHFCAGRLRGMDDFFAAGFPAATAIGHPQAVGRLTVYCLASSQAGTRIGNPRQVSPWRYPRQYGRTPPSFARAMRLPGGDALAISGTAAITGHESRHADDLKAQLHELGANLDALLVTAGMPPGFDHDASLKVYVRHTPDAGAVATFLDQRMPGAARVILHGEVCRRELLVEIDGWRYR
jgi:chorismate lyase/3-hydroxybenzoate synthase